MGVGNFFLSSSVLDVLNLQRKFLAHLRAEDLRQNDGSKVLGSKLC